MKKAKKSRVYLAIFASAIVLAEIAARAVGIIDFPLYDADNVIGYIPKANQQGRFLQKNEWQFNELHMGSGPFKPSAKNDLLLIGDSIVLGGNPVSQPDRLGQQLEKALSDKASVWPISAGSWSIRNELTYLRENPTVVTNVDQLVFVLNSGDLVDEASSWRFEETHPRSYPVSALWYALNKYVIKQDRSQPYLPEMLVPKGSWKEDLTAFLKTPGVAGKPITFVIYPDINEIATPAQPGGRLKSMQTSLSELGNFRYIHVDQDKRWEKSLYRDGIHPNTEGNKILASIIRDHLNAP